MSTNEPMTKEQIDAIASRAAAAERGPWEVMNGGDNETSTFIDGPEGDVLIRDWRGSAYLREEYVWVEKPNAEFIAHAREDIPALLAELDRLRGQLGDAWDEGFEAGEANENHVYWNAEGTGVTNPYREGTES